MKRGAATPDEAQVNLYGYILETEYGMSVAGYYLAQVHPSVAVFICFCGQPLLFCMFLVITCCDGFRQFIGRVRF